MADTIAFVAPRYGLEFVGGAEGIIREMAEALHRTGVSVEVLTTCSNDILVWNNFYQPGTTAINDVTVHRFRTDKVDQAASNRVGERAFKEPGRVSYREQQIYIENSINSLELYDHLRKHSEKYRCCIAGPYLFGTAYFAAQAMQGKTIHLPCLHDEPHAHFDIFREMFEEARGILFNSPEEQGLARRLGITNPATAVVGCGFEQPGPGDPERFYAEYGLKDTPFLLYSGRYEQTKNVPLLIDYFQRYKREHQIPLRLVLAGRGTVPIPDHPDIVDLGFFRPGTLGDVLSASLALVQLSVAESFSLVIMEAWLQGRPVIVHRDCQVTRGHVERSSGGWVAGTYEEFASAVDAMLGDTTEAGRRGAAGNRYVTTEYSWDNVLRKFHGAIDSFMAPRSLYDDLSQRARRRALDFTEERIEDQFQEFVDKISPVDLLTEQVDQLRPLANITMPEYRVEARTPVVGRLIAWARGQLTSHIREPYLDPILQRQERFNHAVQAQVARLARFSAQRSGQSDRVKLRQHQAELAMLRARVARLEARLAELEMDGVNEDGTGIGNQMSQAE